MLVAVLALGIALGGTAVAASRYVITSASQIKPSALEAITHLALTRKFEEKGPLETIEPGKIGVANARCPQGTALLSGGYSLEGAGKAEEEAANVSMLSDGPVGATAWWVAVMDRSSTIPIHIRGRALCMRPDSEL
jgi:hypothetical protein